MSRNLFIVYDGEFDLPDMRTIDHVLFVLAIVWYNLAILLLREG